MANLQSGVWEPVRWVSAAVLQVVAFVTTLPAVMISGRFQVGWWLCLGRDDGWFLFSLVPLWEATTEKEVIGIEHEVGT